MMPRTVPGKGVRSALVSVSTVLGLLACLWALRVLLVMSWFGEDAIPPESRIPDLPSGARVIAQGKECGSGGCWLEVTVVPAAGQLPEDLAREMDISEVQRSLPTLLDPGFVYVWGHPRAGRLDIVVSYRK
ncbi:hypothetical protein Aph02nite_45720 [Actinoplanes philippinensis]|uniref:Uncharacterized protein n=1 Tax=Actinoplanes philippinensis TaxID=35752 RepID=A0A1I2I4W0_9ACTN|nr:hypothetical protein [Actinoplanes philippinensis]GIE78622.1 hypothetical protein Aph02nite_45720 [Actinoplanes philippinensis]SFF37312.1 hypothetical protein SAMN05421541_109309 [Actinoplanes philippinensis]